MLHPIPESSHRKTMLRIVVLQRRLIRALCAIPATVIPDETWLRGVWPKLPTAWVAEFWSKQKGARANQIRAIAAATANEKHTILALLDEQLRFYILYRSPGAHRLTQTNWNTPRNRPPTLLTKTRQLMESFYDPFLYSSFGYWGVSREFTTAARFSKDVYLASTDQDALRVCPYCDNFMQKCELDHFLPKSQFPFLSCHPDNLVPSCSDSNSITHKGRREPLSFTYADQVADWFHPRWNSAKDRFRISISQTPGRQLSLELESVAPVDRQRVANLDTLFHLKEFWEKGLDAEIRSIVQEVQKSLRAHGKPIDDANVRLQLQLLANNAEDNVGKRGLSYRSAALYRFVESNAAMRAEIVASA